MKFGSACRTGLVAATLVLGALAAEAAPLTFFGSDPGAGGVFPVDATNPALKAQAAFEAQVDVTKREAFTSSTTGFIGVTGNSTPVFGDTGTLTQVDPAAGLAGARIFSGNVSNGRFNTTGGNASGAWIQTDWNFTLDIGQRVGAFAFFGTDFGDFDSVLAIELFDGTTSVAANVFLGANSGTPGAKPSSGSLLFFGYASDEIFFDRIVFTITQPAGGNVDTLGFDDLRVGNLRQTTPPGTVPEPGSLALAGLALFAAGWARKARPAA